MNERVGRIMTYKGYRALNFPEFTSETELLCVVHKGDTLHWWLSRGGTFSKVVTKINPGTPLPIQLRGGKFLPRDIRVKVECPHKK